MDAKKDNANTSPKTKKQTKQKKPEQAPGKSTKPPRKPLPLGDWIVTTERKAEVARPADYTFKKLTSIVPMAPEKARLSRLGILEKGPNFRLLSRGLWLNNNKLRSIANLPDLVNGIFEYPDLLGYLDLSCNELASIHEDLFKYPNIAVLYLHGNKISDPTEVFKLRRLKKLKHLTIYGNPMCTRTELGSVRKLISTYLPNLAKLDHNRYTRLEKEAPLATHALKMLRKVEPAPEDWLFKKFPKPKLTERIREKCNIKADIVPVEEEQEEQECNC